MPLEVLYATAGVARLLAWECAFREPGTAGEWLLVALLLEVGFLGLLRPGELLSLTGGAGVL